MTMQYKIIPPPIMGINRQDHPAFMNTAFCYDLYNMEIHNTYIRKRFGYSTLGTGIDSTLTGLDVYEFVDGSGVKHLLGFTNKYIYEFDNSSQVWNRVHTSKLMTLRDATAASWADSGAKVTYSDESGWDQFILVHPNNFIINEVLATHTFDPTLDITKLTYIKFTIESDVTIAANTLRLTLYDNAAKKMNCLISASLVAATPQTLSFFIDTLIDAAFDKTKLTYIKLEVQTALTTAANITIKLIDTITGEYGLESTASRISKAICLDLTASIPGWLSGTGLVISDGVANVLHYDGDSGATFDVLDLLTDITDFVNVKEICFDNGHLELFAFRDDAYRYKNVRWSNVYDCDGAGAWTTGTTGEALLPMVRGTIRRVISMNKNKIIYSDRSITVQSYVGGNDIYAFDSISNDLGIVGDKAVIEFITSNLFMGDNLNIYELNSSGQLSSMSDLINAFIISDFNLTYKNKFFFWHDKTNKKMYLFYSSYDDSGLIRSYIAINMLYGRLAWERGKFADSLVAFADYVSDVDYRCSSPLFSGLQCDNATYGAWMCSDARVLGGGTTPVFISESAKISVLDYNKVTDNGTNVPCHYETGDVVIQDASEITYFRASKISVNATNMRSTVSSTLKVEYSLDAGNTYVECVDSPITLSDEWTTYTLDVDDTQTRQIRFRFSNSYGDLEIAELTLHYTPISVMD